MEPLTILLQPKSYLNHVLYNLITAYLYTASICLFKYLIICRPTKASYPTFPPQSASINNFPLPLHKTLVCFTNADMILLQRLQRGLSHDRRTDAAQLRLLVPTKYQHVPLGPLRCRRIYVDTIGDVNMTQCSSTALMFLGLNCVVFDPLRKRAESYLIKIVKYFVAWRKFLSIFNNVLSHTGNACDGILSCYDVFPKVYVNDEWCLKRNWPWSNSFKQLDKQLHLLHIRRVQFKLFK